MNTTIIPQRVIPCFNPTPRKLRDLATTLHKIAHLAADLDAEAGDTTDYRALCLQMEGMARKAVSRLYRKAAPVGQAETLGAHFGFDPEESEVTP